jgi:hypothetical protein
MVETTALHMNNRAQVEAVLDGSIMLGIGYFDSALDEDEREQLVLGCCFVCRLGSAARKVAEFQNERC